MTEREIQRHIRSIVAQVVDVAKPKRILLFGSAVDGLMGPDSDLDFLVVVPDGYDVHDVTDRLNLAVRHKPLPCDFLVVNSTSLKKHRNTAGLVYREALDRGREVYAA